VSEGQLLVSCGCAQADHTVRIVDPESGKPRPHGEVGEILVSGPSVTGGYFEEDEETTKTYLECDGRHWLHTGDLGFEDDGGIFITGRRKDLIIIRGQNLYPQDVERTVEERVEVIRKGRTVAFPVEVDGRESIGVAAEVSPTLLKWIEPAAVCEAIRARVSEMHGEAPEVVVLLRAGGIPITSSGKLQRSECRRLWLRGELDVLATHEPPRTTG
jgi:acyl-CoA synthetase (AMP-forming)/AMP-acid ligase II